MNWLRELPLRLTSRAKRLDCGGFSTALRRTQRGPKLSRVSERHGLTPH